MDVKKYIDFSREYMKKAVKYGKSQSASIVNSGKSIIKSVISILNNVQSYVIRSQDPKVQAFKTTVSTLLVSATLVYGGFQAKKVIAPSEDSVQKSTQQDGNQKSGQQAGHQQAVAEFPALFSYDKNKQCESSNLPSYINISMGWGSSGKSMSMVDDFEKLSPPSVIITAAGNAANDKPPKPLVNENKQIASKRYDVIVVGSIDNQTNKSVFSQKGEEVAVVAPSDYMISTTSKNGYYEKFSGTSGATPLVTGALAGFTWLSGYQPTGAEAKVLLKGTAIPLRLSNENPQMNGPGMLNAYKLGMVGKRLKEQCGSDIYCYRNKIQDSATYEFKEDTAILGLVDQAFPECNVFGKDRCSKGRDSCQDMGEVFDRLRKAALLNPSKKEYWSALACVYGSAGFVDSAKGMQNIYKGLSGAVPGGDGIDRSCKVDEDCIYAPDCSENFNVKSMEYNRKRDWLGVKDIIVNKDYISECAGLLCVAPRSERETSDGKTMRTRCVNSQCVEEELKAGTEKARGQR